MTRGHPAGGTILLQNKDGKYHQCRSKPMYSPYRYRDPTVFYVPGYPKGPGKSGMDRKMVRRRQKANRVVLGIPKRKPVHKEGYVQWDFVAQEPTNENIRNLTGRALQIAEGKARRLRSDFGKKKGKRAPAKGGIPAGVKRSRKKKLRRILPPTPPYTPRRKKPKT